jgi:hypothetical protein
VFGIIGTRPQTSFQGGLSRPEAHTRDGNLPVCASLLFYDCSFGRELTSFLPGF